jgi:hypothetical protein
MGRLRPVAASLTAPTTYDYSYTWNATDSEQYFNVNGVDSIPLYTRTADGVYFNYTTTFNVIDGLIATHTFNRSNTAWQSSGTFYKPDEDKIGSDNTVGTVSLKYYLKFDNQTKNDYLFNLDNSSSTGSVSVNRIQYGTFLTTFFTNAPTTLQPLIITSYSIVEIYVVSSSLPRYIDAWYLEDLGISEAYQAGLDAETDGILTDYLGTDAQQIGWVLIGIAAILFAFKGGK